jgi:iron complex transport system substrate-binding protein
LIVVVGVLAAFASITAAQKAAPDTRPKVTRIVSLVPAVTEMLFAIGAGPRVVGVSSFDAYPPEVQKLPHLGALLDPDTERILALRPDLVVVYGSQDDLKSRFERAGIRTFSYRHGGFEAVFGAIRNLGRTTGLQAEADRLTMELRARIEAVRARVRGRPRPKTLLVFERQPGTLRNMYASGGVGFTHDMLDAAGGANVFADVKKEAVQPSHETLLTRAPEVVLEVRATGLLSDRDINRDRAAWSALPSLPAVRRGQVHFLIGEHLVVPGPRLAQGIEALARVLHPEAFQ